MVAIAEEMENDGFIVILHKKVPGNLRFRVLLFIINVVK